MPGRRADRVAKQVVQALAAMLDRHTGDPRLQGVTFTGARMTPDLKNVRVFFSHIGDRDERDAATQALAKANGFLRREITRDLDLRFSPQLSFEFDDSFDTADRIERLLKEAEGRR